MDPVLMYIANHQVHLVGDCDITSNKILTSVHRLQWCRDPIGSKRIGCIVGCGKDSHHRKSCGAEPSSWNPVTRKGLTSGGAEYPIAVRISCTSNRIPRLYNTA